MTVYLKLNSTAELLMCHTFEAIPRPDVFWKFDLSYGSTVHSKVGIC